MPSPASRSYRAAVKRAGGRNSLLRASQAQAYVDAMRSQPESAEPPRGLRRSVHIEHRLLDLGDGVQWPMFDITPPGLDPDAAGVLYFHGGAYVGQMSHEAWYFVARLATCAMRRVTVAIYPLVPFVTAERLVEQAREAVRREQDRSGPVTLIGDSAGGGLALAATMAGRDAGAVLPTSLALISPWADVTLSHPDVAARARRDVMLAPAGLRQFGELYRGTLAADDWRVSPLHGDFSGLPPTQIFAAEDDVLYSDATRLFEHLRNAQPASELRIGARMLHAWPLANIPEGATALNDIVRFSHAFAATSRRTNRS